jgi:hypothetical protein
MNDATAGAAVQPNASLEEFARNGEKRSWLGSCRTFASILRAAITNGEHMPVMPELCKADVNTANIVLQSASVIFAATFASSSDTNSVTWNLLGILRAQKIPHILRAIAWLPMEKALASKMFFIGVYLALFLLDWMTLPLLAAEIRQFGSDPDVCQAV